VLPLLKKYELISFAVCCALYLAAGYFWFSNAHSGEELFMSIVIVIVTVFVTVRFIKSFSHSRAIWKLKQMVNLYDQSCDPEAFIEAGRKQVEGVVDDDDYDLTASWFLAFYTRALFDAGHTQEAYALFDKLRNAVDDKPGSKIRSAQIANLVSTIRDLMGGSYALDALLEVDRLLEGETIVNSPRRSYTIWERDNLIAQRDGNLEELASRMRKASDNANNSMLIRVDCAAREALVHQTTHNAAAEEERLSFIIQNGGKLSYVGRAQARLAQLREEQSRFFAYQQ